MNKMPFGCGLVGLFLAVFALVAWIKGIIMAFTASTVLGIVCIFVEVPFPVFAIVYWVTGVDLAQRIVQAFPGIFG